MSDQTVPTNVTLSVDEIRATLIFLSVAKSTYDFLGRMLGDGEERFSHQRLTIESLSIAYRTMLASVVKSQADREVPARVVAQSHDSTKGKRRKK